MARSTGPVLVAGGLAMANEVIFSPAATGHSADWGPVLKLIPVTAGLALALAGVEKAAPQFAAGLGWLLVAGVLIFPMGTAGSLIGNVNKTFGY